MPSTDIGVGEVSAGGKGGGDVDSREARGAVSMAKSEG